jgi:hypothetical protein
MQPVFISAGSSRHRLTTLLRDSFEPEKLRSLANPSKEEF